MCRHVDQVMRAKQVNNFSAGHAFDKKISQLDDRRGQSCPRPARTNSSPDSLGPNSSFPNDDTSSDYQINNLNIKLPGGVNFPS